MPSGFTISATGHGVLFLAAILGGFFRGAPPPPPEISDVSIVSFEEFQALTQVDTTPSPVTEVPIPEAPVEDLPAASPEPEERAEEGTRAQTAASDWGKKERTSD